MFDLSDMNLGSVTSGVGRSQSEKDITSAPRSHLVHTEPGASVIAFQPVDRRSLRPYSVPFFGKIKLMSLDGFARRKKDCPGVALTTL